VSLDVLVRREVADHHFARDVADQRRPDGDEHGEAIHELHQHRAAEQDQRHGDQQPEEQHAVMPLGGARHAEHVVQAHDDVRDDDGPHRFPEIARALEIAVAILGKEQLDADPDEQNAADQLDVGHRHQGSGERGEQRHQHDDAAGTDDEGPALVLRIERAAGERDDDGVVAAQHHVDDRDLDQRRPHFGVGEVGQHPLLRF
jgi:hypothetical protein